MLICASVLAAVSCIMGFTARKKASLSAAALILFYLAITCAGSGYMSYRLNARPVFETEYDAEFSGRMTGAPYTDKDGERFVCTLTDVSVNNTDVGFDVRLYLRGDPQELSELGCGQVITGTGHVFCPESVTNPHEYDFGKVLWQEGLGGYISANTEAVIIEGTPGGFRHLLYTARTWITERIDRYFPRCGDIVRALVIGDKREIDTDLREDFSIAGVAHLLAISGLHVSLIAAIIAALLKPVTGARAAAVIAPILVFMYSALVGFAPSVTRAAIMFAFMSTAPLVGRPSDGTTRLSLAFIVILLINPLDIASPGFILSFSASAGLIWLDRPMNQLLCTGRIFKGNDIITRLFKYIAGLFSATVCAQMATYPAIATFYGTFSIISFAANIVLVPLCLVSLAAAIVGIMFPAVAVIPDSMLALLKYLVGVCGDISWAEIRVNAASWWLWVSIFVIGFLVSSLSPLPRKIKPWLLLLMPAVIAVSAVYTPVPEAHSVFLDAGQADSTVVVIGDSVCVVDLGTDAEATIAYVNGESLKVDALFLSHPHSDHAGGLGEFAAECDIGMIYIPESWFDEMTGESMINEWNAVVSSGVQYKVLSTGDTIPLDDGAYVEVLDCRAYTGDSGNDSSMILLLDYGETEILFTGDAKAEIPPDIDILKVGHHGARDATDAGLLAYATPEIAVISVGKDNKYGHPHEEVIALLEDCGADVYRTDADGAVTVTFDKYGKLSVGTFMEDNK